MLAMLVPPGMLLPLVGSTVVQCSTLLLIGLSADVRSPRADLPGSVNLLDIPYSMLLLLSHAWTPLCMHAGSAMSCK